MKKNDILLDFTSLLDVVLIILFFFVLYSQFEMDQNKAILQMQVDEAESKISEANYQLELSNELNDRLRYELDIVSSSNERYAANIQALLEFNRGDNIKLILKMDDNDWKLNILKSNQVISKISSQLDLTSEIIKIFTKEGYNQSDSLFVEFILDGSEPGTASAYRKISEAINKVKLQYNYLYYSETDISEVED